MPDLFGTFENFQDAKPVLEKYEKHLYKAYDHHDHIHIKVSTMQDGYQKIIWELEDLNYEIRDSYYFLVDELEMDVYSFCAFKRI